MQAFLGGLLNQIPAGAWGMLVVMVAMTFALIRCALHPTLFALVAWPGTLAHELAHAAVGFVLGGKPSNLSLFPKSLGNGRWELGSVSFSNLRWWSAPWTAMAPMLLAPLSFVLAVYWAYPVWESGNLATTAIALYVCSTILQASWPSSKDFEVAFPGLVVIGIVVAVLY